MAAFLWAQMEEADSITRQRLEIWNSYQNSLARLEEEGFRGPFVPDECEHNGHMHFVLLRSDRARNELIKFMKREGIHVIFHGSPLHQSTISLPGKSTGDLLPVTEKTSLRIATFPLRLGVD